MQSLAVQNCSTNNKRPSGIRAGLTSPSDVGRKEEGLCGAAWRIIMKDVRGGGQKKIEGALPQRLQGDEEEDNVIACDSRMEVVRAEQAAGEFNEDSDVDDEGEDEEEKVGEEDEEERPKLDEGFYEIEDVRRKRIRKGQIQYLIKWRGWPENANTWEPLENLQSCFDVIESFENRLKSGNHRPARYCRKRKRKQGGSHAQTKKKQRSTSTSSLPCIKVESGHRHLLSAPLVSSSLSKSPPLESNESNHLNEVANCPGNGVLAELPPENVSVNVLLEDDQDKEADLTRSNVEGALAGKLNAGRILTHVSDVVALDCDGLKEELQKAECLNLTQTSRCTGARKRKSGFVRRFKQESTSHELGDTQNSIARCIIESGDKFGALGVEDAKSLGDDLGDKNNLDASVTPFSITKIIKAIGYSTSISNNVQDVSITFVAMRSDGREVVVDSKFLKVNNPLLLISFYEQHLRYNPST